MKTAQKKVECSVRSLTGNKESSMELNPEVFAARQYEHMVHQVVRWQLAKRRSGTHNALTRSQIEGGKKKPYKQKGTGRARAGSSVSPLWVGGAVVHGPTPRSYEFKVPKEIRRKALCSVLSEKAKSNQLIVLDDVSIKNGKTSEVAKGLKNLGINKESVLVVTMEAVNDASNLTARACRNIPKLKVVPVSGVNVYDVMKHKFLLISKDALAGVEARGLGNGVSTEQAEA